MDTMTREATGKIENDVLVLRIPLHAKALSGSGKSFNYANETFRPEGCKIDGQQLKVTISAYVPNPGYVRQD